MSSIPQVSQTMERILTTRAKALERETEFVQRSTAELDGPIFTQTCVLTWMHTPQAGYSQLRHTAARMASPCQQPGDRATRKSGLGPSGASLVRRGRGRGHQQ